MGMISKTDLRDSLKQDIDKIPNIEQSVASLQADYATLKGDLSTLQTTAKDSIPNIINELFTNVSNGKQLVGTAITDVDSFLVVPTSPTFQNLADLIRSISTGKKYASGTVTLSSEPYGGIVATGLDFQPSIILIIEEINTNYYFMRLYNVNTKYRFFNDVRFVYNVGSYSVNTGTNWIWTITSNGFSTRIGNPGETAEWIAVEW